MNSHPSPSSSPRSALAPAGSPSAALAKAGRHPLTASSRTGKIARLPAAIRDELNSRLHDGEPAASLLPWLNALPEVQSILAAHFHGRPVTKQNLSEWRRGGFTDWLQLQESRAWLTHLREQATALQNDSGDASAASALLAAPLAVALGRTLQHLSANASAKPAHLHRLLDLASGLNRLRRYDHAEARLRLETRRTLSDVALAEHRLEVERSRWQTEQAQAVIAAREKIESDKIKAEEDKIHRVRVAQRRAKFYGADNPYAAMDAAVLAAANLPVPAPPPAKSPQTASSPSLAEQEAALERINALLARASSTLLPAPGSPLSAPPSPPPASHPVAPSPTKSNQTIPPTEPAPAGLSSAAMAKEGLPSAALA